MSDAFEFEDAGFSVFEPEFVEKKKRKSSAHLRIIFDGIIPTLKGASCKHHPIPLWDLDIDKESRHARANRHFDAKSICGGCPAKTECLDWATGRQATDDDVRGVWGGKVFAPDSVSYPRCEVCDHALALSQNPRRKVRTGYVGRSGSEENANICIHCAAALGYVEPDHDPDPETAEAV